MVSLVGVSVGILSHGPFSAGDWTEFNKGILYKGEDRV